MPKWQPLKILTYVYDFYCYLYIIYTLYLYFIWSMNAYWILGSIFYLYIFSFKCSFKSFIVSDNKELPSCIWIWFCLTAEQF